jgi:hypothetical protein
MDATLAFEGIISDFNALLESRDFEGAEETLVAALTTHREWEPLIHFQLGRLYRRWNKLSSSINHLTRAVEVLSQSSERLFLLQVTEELKLARQEQLLQRP